MEVRKINYSVKGRAKHEEDRKLKFPVIAKLDQQERKNAPLSSSDSFKNEVKTSFRLPRINLNRTLSHCNRSYSHGNFYGKSGIRSLANIGITTSNRRQQTNVFRKDAEVKISPSNTELNVCEKLLKSVKIVHAQISDKRTKFQEETCLNICRMELTPRLPRTPKEETIQKQKLAPTEFQVIYPTLRLTSTDRKAIFKTSPSLSWSMESLDSILGGGALTLTQPPPEILSSCSPSECELTPPSTPKGKRKF